MSDLRELFDELAQTPAPPPALVADSVFMAGRRRYRRRRRVQVALAAAFAVLALGTGLSLAALPQSAGVPADVVPADPRPDPRPGVTGDRAVIRWIGAPDVMHVYLAYPACGGASCPKTRFDLIGSDDGGRTWSTRASDLGIIPRQVLPSGTLLGQEADVTGEQMSSMDGGRTWRAISRGPGSTPAVPPGGGLLCGQRTGSCELFAVDARGETLVMLANRPPAFVAHEVVKVAGSRVWVTGVDTLARRPALATSVDGGATWSVHPLTDRPACDDPGSCVMPNVGVNEQGMAVAMFVGRDELTEIFRSTGDGWTRLDAGALDGTASWSYVAADGTHIVQTTGGEQRFWAVAPAADRYTQVKLTGLPAPVSPVRLEPDGRYYTALAEDASQLFRSTDGIHWSAVTTP